MIGATVRKPARWKLPCLHTRGTYSQTTLFLADNPSQLTMRGEEGCDHKEERLDVAVSLIYVIQMQK